MNKIEDVAVIGMGPAGIAAAIYIKRFGYEPVCFDGGKVGGKLNSIKEIENYPGFVGDGKDLAEMLSKQVEHFELNVKKELVSKISRDYESGIFTVKSEEGEYLFKSVILAVGIREKPFEVKGSAKYGNNGISRCATCDGPFYRNKVVALLGNSTQALEDADYLSTICQKVYLLNSENELKANEEVCEEIYKNEKIEIINNIEISASEGKMHLESLTLKDKLSGEERTIETSALFILIGTTPITEFLDYMDVLDERGFIKSDASMKTSVEGLFVAGDARVTPLRQVITAGSDGSLAALSCKAYLKEHK